MKERKLQFVKDIHADEVNELLSSFWGTNSEQASISGPLLTYEQTLSALDNLSAIPKKERQIKILEFFKDKSISIGIRNSGQLIAHSGLRFNDFGELETIGSITSRSFREKGLITEINIRKKELIKKFSILGFDPISYVLLGSSSVNQAYNIFEIPEIDLQSKFCNIGPYLISRPNLSRSDIINSLEFDIISKSSVSSSTAEVRGIKIGHPPLVDTRVKNQLPLFWANLFDYYPHKMTLESQSKKRQSVNTINTVGNKIKILTLAKEIPDILRFNKEISDETANGKTIIIKIPLKYGTTNLLNQVKLLFTESNNSKSNFVLIPTGLTVVDNYWTICLSTIKIDRISNYLRLMENLSTNQKGSLKALGVASLGFLNNNI